MLALVIAQCGANNAITKGQWTGDAKDIQFITYTTTDWLELDSNGKNVFNFTLKSMDANKQEVILLDSSREMFIKIANTQLYWGLSITAISNFYRTGKWVIFPTNTPRLSNNFYIIANNINKLDQIDWAIKNGANGIAVDIHFDTSGKPRFTGSNILCDCICMGQTSDSVCKFDNACLGSHDAEKYLQYVASNYSSLPLLYFDSITKGFNLDLQLKSGIQTVDFAVANLFNKGFKGKILINSGTERDYIRSAAKRAKDSAYASRIFFTLDFESGAGSTIDFLRGLNYSNIVYSTGVSACSPNTYYSEIVAAARNKFSNLVSNVFIWTLDADSSFQKYYDFGARGIVTNKPAALFAWAQKNGLTLAKVNNDSLTSTTGVGATIYEKLAQFLLYKSDNKNNPLDITDNM